MSEELKAACPFCGETKSLYVIHIEGTILHPSYYVECDNCGARGPSTDKGNHVGIWNRRVGAERALAGAVAENVETTRQLELYRRAINRLDDMTEYARDEVSKDELRNIFAWLTENLTHQPTQRGEEKDG